MSLKFTTIAVAAFFAGTIAGNATELRLSHQWSTSDVRHQVAQIVADEVAAANVDLEIKIFPTQSLFKAREQYTPLSRGQLDMTADAGSSQKSRSCRAPQRESVHGSAGREDGTG